MVVCLMNFPQDLALPRKKEILQENEEFSISANFTVDTQIYSAIKVKIMACLRDLWSLFFASSMITSFHNHN